MGGWEWRFPKDLTHEGGQRALKDMAGEVVEAAWALASVEARTSMTDERAAQAAAVELMDVIHVAETALRHLELERCVDLDRAFAATVAKNEERGYYDPLSW